MTTRSTSSTTIRQATAFEARMPRAGASWTGRSRSPLDRDRQSGPSCDTCLRGGTSDQTSGSRGSMPQLWREPSRTGTVPVLVLRDAGKGTSHELFVDPRGPRGPRLGDAGAQPSGRVHRHLHRPLHQRQRDQTARRHRRDGPPLLLVHGWPENWYAWRLVMPSTSRELHRHRRRPARHRTDREAFQRVRRRDPGQRPDRADGRARPRTVRGGRPRHRPGDQLRPGRGPPGPGRPRRSARGARTAHARPLTAAVCSRSGQQQAVAHRVQPGGRGGRAARRRTGEGLLRLRVHDPGRTPARRGRRLLRRPRLNPRRPARQLRVLPGVGRHHGPERQIAPPPR